MDFVVAWNKRVGVGVATHTYCTCRLAMYESYCTCTCTVVLLFGPDGGKHTVSSARTKSEDEVFQEKHGRESRSSSSPGGCKGGLFEGWHSFMHQETHKGASEVRAQPHVECWLCHLMNESFIESVRDDVS